MLHQPILAGVIGDDGEHAAWLEPVAKLGKRPVETRQLVVHGNAQRLEQAGEIRRPRPRTQGATDRPDEIVADRERTVFAPPNDLPRQSMRPVLIAVLAEDGRERVLIRGIEQLRGGDPGGIGAPVHPHVERRVFTKREASIRIVDLMRRNTEVEQDARELLIRELRNLVNVREVAEVGSKPALRRKRGKPFARSFEGIGIAIDSDHLLDASFE